MMRIVCPCLVVAFAALALPSHAGLFPKVRLPRINIGKGVKAVVYPVTKTAVNGGKAAISGGETAVKVYGTYRSLAPNAKGIPSIPRLK